jgi:predicted dienelactone hydrolase
MFSDLILKWSRALVFPTKIKNRNKNNRWKKIFLALIVNRILIRNKMKKSPVLHPCKSGYKTFYCRSRLLLILLTIILSAGIHISLAQETEWKYINGDALPDAPELALRGDFKIGVRTITVVNKGQIDILNTKGGIEPTYDRTLKLEIWYPASVSDGMTELVTYEEERPVPNDPKRQLINYEFQGRAIRDAMPDLKDGAFPLLIVSHGYVGSRFLMTYLTENLASKGYVVVAIDHMESTYSDAGGFQSTLLNRSRDILFVLNQIAELSKPGSNNFLVGLVDVNKTALIGYSMGGYGVLNAAGAGYSPNLVTMFSAMTGGNKAIEELCINNPIYKAVYDNRIKAVIAFAPWGMQRNIWDSEGLKGLKVPVLFIAGSLDDISGYEKGTRAIFDGAVNADRYLLTYINARHNVAPNPPPLESLKPGLPIDFYYHYAEPAWDQRRINNINQHFVTAFLGIHLKNIDYGQYLELPENSNANTWKGFKQRTSVGLELLHSAATKPN